MSIHYLYVSQHDEEPSSIIVSDYKTLQSNIKDMKFMIMHCGGDIMACISRFLTKSGYIFTQAAHHAPLAITSNVFRITQSRPFPMSDLYLTLGPLQSEVIMKLYHRQPIDVDIKSLVNNVALIEHRISESDKLIATIVTENMQLREANKHLSSGTIDLRKKIETLETTNAEMMNRIDYMTLQISSLEGSVNEKINDITATLAKGVIINKDYFEDDTESSATPTIAESISNDQPEDVPDAENKTIAENNTITDETVETQQKTLWSRWF